MIFNENVACFVGTNHVIIRHDVGTSSFCKHFASLHVNYVTDLIKLRYIYRNVSLHVKSMLAFVLLQMYVEICGGNCPFDPLVMPMRRMPDFWTKVFGHFSP